MFSAFNLILLKQNSLLAFYSKAVKHKQDVLTRILLPVCRFTEVSSLLHNDTSHVRNWQGVLAAVVLSADELVELQFTASLHLK